MRSLQRKNLNKWQGVSFTGVRLRKPSSCNTCPYAMADYKYRECFFARCPYDKSKITLREEPLELPDVIELRKETMKPWERQQLLPLLTKKGERRKQ